MAGESALVLFAHGSRDTGWARPFEFLRARLEERLPGTPVALAFLEHMQPSLIETIGTLADRGVERITVLPLFMAQGSHLREELPRLVARACEANPGVLVRTSAAAGEADSVLQALAEWALGEHRLTLDSDLGHPLA
jgi:sirohydrochlorin cobaltochelatase